jgi:serine/threonine protein kinase
VPTLRAGAALKHQTFVIERLIGRGGFGEVYLAHQPRMDRHVAIKVLTPGVTDDPRMLALFEREARAAGRLAHPNIVPIFDFDYDLDEQVHFIAMQYVEGGRTLADSLGAPIDPARLRLVLSRVADALDHAHEAGVIHRDVKPTNILIGPRERPLLTDFGIARLGATSGTTTLGSHMGTARYMAPERWRGEAAGAASDQYALAVVAYELLAGRPPFVGESDSLAYQHLSLDPPPVALFNALVPTEVDEVLSRALAKYAPERFPSCRMFATALASSFNTGTVGGGPQVSRLTPPAHSPRAPRSDPPPPVQPGRGSASNTTLDLVGQASPMESLPSDVNGVQPMGRPGARLAARRWKRVAGTVLVALILGAGALSGVGGRLGLGNPSIGVPVSPGSAPAAGGGGELGTMGMESPSSAPDVETTCLMVDLNTGFGKLSIRTSKPSALQC